MEFQKLVGELFALRENLLSEILVVRFNCLEKLIVFDFRHSVCIFETIELNFLRNFDFWNNVKFYFLQ